MPPVIQRLISRITQLLKKPNAYSILIVTFFLFFSKGLGFIRQILIYQRMDSLASDLLFAALRLPNTITSLLIMGTIFTSVLPVAGRLDAQKDPDKNSLTYLQYMLIIILIPIGLGSLLVFITAPFILQLPWVTNPEFLGNLEQQGLLQDYILVTRILLLGPVLFSFQSILGVFLNLKRRFAVYSWSGVIYNLGTIAGLIFAQPNNYFAVSWGMMAGLIITILIYIVEVYRAGWTGYLHSMHNLVKNLRQYMPEFKQTWKLLLPRILIINGTVMANFIIGSVAQEPGQITAFDIGLSIQEIFFTLVVATGTVFFPDLSQVLHDPNLPPQTFWQKLKQYTLLAAGIGLAGSLITILGVPILIWFFELFGQGQNNGNYIILITRIGTIALMFQSMNEILGKYFHVKERIWQPVILSVLSTGGQILSVILMTPYQLDPGIIAVVSLIVHHCLLAALSLQFIQTDKTKSLRNIPTTS